MGSWSIRGRTVGADADNVSARTTFEWLPGGFFLKQIFEADFAGMRLRALEPIRYGPVTDTFPSTVHPNPVGVPIPDRYDLRGAEVAITTDPAGGASMTGRTRQRRR